VITGFPALRFFYETQRPSRLTAKDAASRERQISSKREVLSRARYRIVEDIELHYSPSSSSEAVAFQLYVDPLRTRVYTCSIPLSEVEFQAAAEKVI
jgi:hypothetical protein